VSSRHHSIRQLASEVDRACHRKSVIGVAFPEALGPKR
jgi:hypothetical protein